MNFSNIQSALDDSDRRLLSRADELRARAAGGSPAFSGFLSPREVYILTAFGFETKCRRDELTSQDSIGFFWGGYPDAERKIYISLPGFMAYTLPERENDASDAVDFTPAELAELVPEELGRHISRLLIKKSGYVTLSHRDYMGALLGLGIERDHVGDIILVDEGAVVFAEPGIANFLKNSLSAVGRDHVKVAEAPEDIKLSRDFEAVTGTVASARLDSVVSELTNCSRETAKELIRRGFVEHDHFPAVDADAEVADGDVISVRRDGKVKGGKFVVDKIGELTNKGRVRLFARRYL